MNNTYSPRNEISGSSYMRSLDGMTVVFTKTNLLDRDPRLSKEIYSLKKAGCSVILLCWDRDCTTSSKDEILDNKYKEIRLKLKAPYGVKVLPFLPFWWLFEFYWLLKLRMDLIHAINLDTIFPVVVASKIKNVATIYEMFDTYEDEVILPKLLRNFLINIDKIFMRAVKAVIIVDEARLEEFNGIPNSNIVVIYNSPIDAIESVYSPPLKQNCDTFVIFYAGALYAARGLKLNNVLSAIKNIENCKIIIAGYGDQVTEIEGWENEVPDKVQFIGRIDYSEVIERTLKSDLLIAIYDPSIMNIKCTSANKLFEAMMCRKPIVVSKDTGTANLVNKLSCGLVVDCNDINEIKDAILTLKESPKLYSQLAENGRVAYVREFSWSIMSQRLISLYREVGHKDN